MSTIAQRLLNLYNKMVIANNVTNEFTQALPDCYEAVEEKGGTLPAEQTAANLPDAISSIPEALPFGFTPSASSPELTSVLSIMVDNRIITEVDDPTITYIYNNDLFRGQVNLVRVSLPNLTSLQGYTTFYGCTNLEELNLPNLQTMANIPTESWNANSWRFYATKIKEVVLPKVTNIVGDRVFETAGGGVCQLEKISVPELTTWRGGQWWYGAADDLIDVELGKNFTSNFSYLAKWTAVNAIKSDSTSLVKPGESFASNLEKLLYNIREHIAKNLNPNVTATITFHANVYNAIQADAATVAAFPASWTIASA